MNEVKTNETKKLDVNIVELKKTPGWKWATDKHPTNDMADYWITVLVAAAYNEGLKDGKAEKEEASN